MARNRKTDKENEKGSFLIELLLAFTIISMSMTVIIDSFVTSQHSYYSTSNKADLTSVLAFVLEDMTREARVSSEYTCTGSPCTNVTMTRIQGLNDVADASNEVITYYLNGANEIVKTEDINGTVTDYKMTPTSVVIDAFSATIFDTSDTAGSPTRVRVSLEAHSKDYTDQIINLQTSFSARKY